METVVPEPVKTKKKMSYKDQLEYDGILDKIAEAEAKIEAREEEMALAGADYDKLQKLTEEVNTLTAEYDALIERWTYLQEIAEA
ncbi:MAG: ABC transporter C-terminal domain-containing protein [Planococcus donghaensis]